MSVAQHLKNENKPNSSHLQALFLSQEGAKSEFENFHKSGTARNNLKFKQQAVIDVFKTSPEEFDNLIERMNECHSCLRFGVFDDGSVADPRTTSCHVHLCPICEAKKVNKYRKMIKDRLAEFEETGQEYDFAMITLTVPTCSVYNLRSQQRRINKAINRLSKLKKIVPIFKGFIRRNEITRSKDGKAHSHIHMLVAFPKGHFKEIQSIKKTYDLIAEKWQKIFKSKQKLQVFVTPAYSKNGSKTLENAVLECVKYTVKDATLLNDVEFFKEMYRQTKGLRFIGFNGVFAELNGNNDINIDEDLHNNKYPNGIKNFKYSSNGYQYSNTHSMDKEAVIRYFERKELVEKSIIGRIYKAANKAAVNHFKNNIHDTYSIKDVNLRAEKLEIIYKEVNQLAEIKQQMALNFYNDKLDKEHRQNEKRRCNYAKKMHFKASKIIFKLYKNNKINGDDKKIKQLIEQLKNHYISIVVIKNRLIEYQKIVKIRYDFDVKLFDLKDKNLLPMCDYFDKNVKDFIIDNYVNYPEELKKIRNKKAA